MVNVQTCRTYPSDTEKNKHRWQCGLRYCFNKNQGIYRSLIPAREVIEVRKWGNIGTGHPLNILLHVSIFHRLKRKLLKWNTPLCDLMLEAWQSSSSSDLYQNDFLWLYHRFLHHMHQKLCWKWSSVHFGDSCHLLHSLAYTNFSGGGYAQ